MAVVLDYVPYGLYGSVVAKTQRKGAERARAELPSLIADAEKGRTTIITRHGRSVAALVPVRRVAASRQQPLTQLAGSGKGMWGRDSATTLRRLRNEWSG
jgi:antitoxin (DNA-binding transcriptional repressor) of toxin-antitoxin stability system